MAQRIPVEVLDNDSPEMQRPARVGKVARIQSQAAINRIAVIERVTVTAATGISAVYTKMAEATEQGIQRLERQDTLMTRLGESATQEHQIAKENLARRHQQIGEAAASAISELYQRDLEDLFCHPDSAFYQPTAREQLSAWFWDNTSIELQRRNLAALTPRENLKEFFVGGVVDAKVAAFDHRQVVERRERLALRRQLDIAYAQLEQLAARNAELEHLTAATIADEIDDHDDDDTDDYDLTTNIDKIEELLRYARGSRPTIDPITDQSQDVR